MTTGRPDGSAVHDSAADGAARGDPDARSVLDYIMSQLPPETQQAVRERLPDALFGVLGSAGGLLSGMEAIQRARIDALDAAATRDICEAVSLLVQVSASAQDGTDGGTALRRATRGEALALLASMKRVREASEAARAAAEADAAAEAPPAGSA